MKIALMGDIALIGRYDRTHTPDVDKRVEVIKQLISECDVVIANLESPLTTKTTTFACKGVYLRSTPANVATLKSIGVTHVTLANNHIYDYGIIGAKETIAVLEKAGIKYVGLNTFPEIIRCGESAIAIDGFCCLSANALNYGNTTGKVKMLSYESMKTFFAFAEKSNCLPIASVHLGLEGIHYPSLEHINLFRTLAEDHTYILHGNHPHAIQGYERVKDSLLIYSQGNLCFDETPITSIHFTPKETLEERKCYISIIEIKQNSIKSCVMIPLTDIGNGILHIDEQVGIELKKYQEALQMPMKMILERRTEEIQRQHETAQKRNIAFYLDRMNYKYIGAYLNGRRNAKAYNKLFKNFMMENR